MVCHGMVYVIGFAPTLCGQSQVRLLHFALTALYDDDYYNAFHALQVGLQMCYISSNVLHIKLHMICLM